MSLRICMIGMLRLFVYHEIVKHSPSNRHKSRTEIIRSVQHPNDYFCSDVLQDLCICCRSANVFLKMTVRGSGNTFNDISVYLYTGLRLRYLKIIITLKKSKSLKTQPMLLQPVSAIPQKGR